MSVQDRTNSLLELKATRRSVFWGGIIVAIIGLGSGLGGNIIDAVQPPALTADSQSVCVNALQNTDTTLKILKITRESQMNEEVLRQLEASNPEDIDSECGEESVMARRILPD